MRYPLKPLGNKILVRAFKVEVMIGDIHLPDICKETPMKSIVLEIGEEGNPDLKEGDIVIAPKYKGHDIELGGEIYRIYEPDDIIGVEK